MKKMVFVKWTFTDDYGRADVKKARFDWFENMEEAENFKAEKRANNGGYFKVFKTAEADYDKFVKMNEMKKIIEEMEKEF